MQFVREGLALIDSNIPLVFAFLIHGEYPPCALPFLPFLLFLFFFFFSVVFLGVSGYFWILLGPFWLFLEAWAAINGCIGLLYVGTMKDMARVNDTPNCVFSGNLLR